MIVALTAVLGSIFAGAGSVLLNMWLRRRDRRAAALAASVRDDANLRDDQREFIRILQEENAMWRRHATEQDATISRLHDRLASVETELAAEKQARRESEARLAAEIEARARLLNGGRHTSTPADERAVHEAGEAAARQVRQEQEPEGPE